MKDSLSLRHEVWTSWIPNPIFIENNHSPTNNTNGVDHNSMKRLG